MIVSGGRIKKPDYEDPESKSTLAAFINKASHLVVNFELIDPNEIPAVIGARLNQFLRPNPNDAASMQELCIDVASRAISGVCQLGGQPVEAFGEPELTPKLLELMEKEPLRMKGSKLVLLGAGPRDHNAIIIAESDGERLAMVLKLHDSFTFANAWYAGRDGPT